MDGNVPCPICGASDVYVYLQGEDTALDASVLGSSRQHLSHGLILRCKRCQFGFRSLRSNEAELAQLYRQMDTAVYESEEECRQRTAARHLGIVQRYVTQGRLLDVGCASGLFLQEAQKAGWSVVGIEPSIGLYQKAAVLLGERGQLFCDTLEYAPLDSSSFEAITLWDVLEHVPNPVASLCRCCRLLKPGGFLFTNVPDLDSLQARILGKRWPLLLAEHLNYFNRNSLRLCGMKAGLTLIRFSRRRVDFSIEYVMYRMAQHGIRGARTAHAVARKVGGRISMPVALGETWGVWTK